MTNHNSSPDRDLRDETFSRVRISLTPSTGDAETEHGLNIVVEEIINGTKAPLMDASPKMPNEKPKMSPEDAARITAAVRGDVFRRR